MNKLRDNVLGRVSVCTAWLAVSLTWCGAYESSAAELLTEVVTISVPDRKDLAFDSTGVMYVSAGDRIFRYDTQTLQPLTPWVLGGDLLGLDVSPDGTTLAVADSTFTGTSSGVGKNKIHLVEIATGVSQAVEFDRDFGEGGTFMPAWGADGRLLVSSQYNGSGSSPLRRYNPADGQVDNLGDVRQDTMLTPSADRLSIGQAESNSSAGRVRFYDVTAGNSPPGTSTGSFVYEIGVNRNGTQSAVPTFSGTLIYDDTFSLIHTISPGSGEGPVGVVYSPNADILYTAWYDFGGGADAIQAFDSSTFTQLDSLDLPPFDWNGNFSLVDGRLEISPDGQWLGVTSGGDDTVTLISVVPEPASMIILLTASPLFLRRGKRQQW